MKILAYNCILMIFFDFSVSKVEIIGQKGRQYSVIIFYDITLEEGE